MNLYLMSTYLTLSKKLAHETRDSITAAGRLLRPDSDSLVRIEWMDALHSRHLHSI